MRKKLNTHDWSPVCSLAHFPLYLQINKLTPKMNLLAN